MPGSGRVGRVLLAVWVLVVSAAVPSAAAAAVSGGSDGAAGAGGGFGDVDGGSVHADAIRRLASEGVFEGTECEDGGFCPGAPLLRWVMAVWLVRIIDGGDPMSGPGPEFADVEDGVWWQRHVERLAELGVTAGCATGPARFCPHEPVTRAQMATFLQRAWELADAEASGAGFVDTGGNTHEASIDALWAAGITAGCATGPARFCPHEPVTRAQMATFLLRASAVGGETPQESTLSSDFTAVSAGRAHSCGLLSDGWVTCWGHLSGRAPSGSFTAVSAASGRSCGLRSDGSITCWGHGGQVSPPSGSFTAVSAASGRSCGLRSDGSITCWGHGWAGVTAVWFVHCGVRWRVACVWAANRPDDRLLG